MQLFISRIGEEPFFVLAWMLVVVFSICVHEFAHAWSALRCGDDTAAAHGHLSLNPLIQMGWGSLVMLVLFGIAWGAVPVDVHRLRSPRAAAWVALAGPIANLVLAFAFSGLLVAGGLLPGGQGSLALDFFKWAALANGVLCLFNLLPIPMFDGWAILSVLIPGLQRLNESSIQSLSWLFLAAVWMTPLGGFIWQAGSRIAYALIVGWAWVAGLFF